MNKKQFLTILALLLVISALIISCVPEEYKTEGDNSKKEMINEAIAEQIKGGPGVMPPAIVMVFGTLVPISGSVG